MRTLIIGSGISGSSIARLLKDRNHDVSIIEKQPNIGGLCITKVSPNGLRYEPFGGRVVHTKNPKIAQFFTRFDDFNGYTHRKGMIINGKLFPFPLTKDSIKNFKEKDQILQEIQNRPPKIDKTNFETASISIFGRTLYNYFIRNYTTKMWGTKPENLSAEWVAKRLEFRETGDDEYFKGQWQGLPKNGYTYLLNKIIEGIPVSLNTSEFNLNDYDVVVSSAPLDEIMQFKFGKLHYRSLKFYYKADAPWDANKYGSINLPQHPNFIRKNNFKIFHKQESSHNWIQFQEAVEADGNNLPMYPVNTEKNHKIFDRYLRGICKTKNVCPIGRLGLCKYLAIDKSVEIAFNMLPIIEDYLRLKPEERYNRIRQIIEKF